MDNFLELLVNTGQMRPEVRDRILKLYAEDGERRWQSGFEDAINLISSRCGFRGEREAIAFLKAKFEETD